MGGESLVMGAVAPTGQLYELPQLTKRAIFRIFIMAQKPVVFGWVTRLILSLSSGLDGDSNNHPEQLNHQSSETR
jgi:hypothetical protein